jgi:hypothetical protein
METLDQEKRALEVASLCEGALAGIMTVSGRRLGSELVNRAVGMEVFRVVRKAIGYALENGALTRGEAQQIAENELVHRGYGAFRQMNEKRLFELSPDGNTRER